jgi:hypothetical protein
VEGGELHLLQLSGTNCLLVTHHSYTRHSPVLYMALTILTLVTHHSNIHHSPTPSNCRHSPLKPLTDHHSTARHSPFCLPTLVTHHPITCHSLFEHLSLTFTNRCHSPFQHSSLAQPSNGRHSPFHQALLTLPNLVPHHSNARHSLLQHSSKFHHCLSQNFPLPQLQRFFLATRSAVQVNEEGKFNGTVREIYRWSSLLLNYLQT